MHAIVGTGGGTGEGHGVRDCDRAREGERKLEREREREGVVEGRETDTGGGGGITVTLLTSGFSSLIGKGMPGIFWHPSSWSVMSVMVSAHSILPLRVTFTTRAVHFHFPYKYNNQPTDA